MREIRQSGSEGGVALTPSSLPLSKRWRACYAQGQSRSIWSVQARLRFVPAPNQSIGSRLLSRKSHRNEVLGFLVW